MYFLDTQLISLFIKPLHDLQMLISAFCNQDTNSACTITDLILVINADLIFMTNISINILGISIIMFSAKAHGSYCSPEKQLQLIYTFL